MPSTIQKQDLLESVVWVDPERMSGAPCFYGTRVPVKNLFDYIAGGDTVDDFLEGFPPVTRAQAEAVLNFALESLLSEVSPR